jgi:DNA-binding beta-propeller fold protein YncE
MKITLYAVWLMMILLSGLPLPAETLTPGQPIELSGTHGKFDFIKVDPIHRRLLACHTQNGTLDIIDVDSCKLLKSIVTGAAQGVAVDDKNGRYFVSVSKPSKRVVIDSTKLEVTGETTLPDPADVMTYHPQLNHAYVCNDEKPELWVIDPNANKILTTLTLPGTGMEDLAFNADGSFLFQNLKESSELAKIDPTRTKVVAFWPTSPAEKPHGMAMVDETNAVLIAGGTGKLVLVDLASGKVLASTDIAQRVDEIAYDPGLHRAYCASGTGFISVVSVGKDSLKTLDSIPSSPGAHSIAVDPKTHTVWIAFARDNKAFVQPFEAATP